MKLRKVIDSYIAYKRSLGMRMRSEERVLGFFYKAMDDIELDRADPQAVLAFIGDATRPGRWRTYYKLLSSFYRYALERGYAHRSPLPQRSPKFPAQTPPYIYSTAELKCLLAAAAALSRTCSPLQPDTYRTLLLLLYGSAIRLGEALALTLPDVDLTAGVLMIRETKFFKTRLVPIGPKLTQTVREYAERRQRLPMPKGEHSAFLATRSGQAADLNSVQTVFRRLRRSAQVHCPDRSARHQPHLHDIRHTSATHRLTAWYREGKDVQQLLPYLSTYLGHRDLESTQRYLTLTPELLQHASERFRRVLPPESRHV
jgi:integrase/recombinase XerD